MIVPMLRVGMPPWTLCVRFGTRSVPGCIPTRSVGTINLKQKSPDLSIRAFSCPASAFTQRPLAALNSRRRRCRTGSV
ncbi:hypothetical protein F7R14_13325 [Pseudomonas lini]|uniref:Uncharacterized protein n=1 Tax=Pseudomonas lini TaxID=163011 RepID=A0A7V7P3P1_9PSED|nr:hypothetical protein F7R14_13325 [Pseudomonas lini]